MKLLAITLLAVCLIHGNTAQPQLGGLRNLFNSATSAARSAASTAARLATNSIADVRNSITEVRSKLSSKAKEVLDNVPSLSVDDMKTELSKLPVPELAKTITSATEEVKIRVSAVQDSLKESLDNVSKSAEETAAAAVNSATSSSNNDVKSIVAKAKAAGVNVKECAVDGVVNLGKESVTSAVSCITDKVKEAATLAKNIAELVPRAITVAKEGAEAYKAYQECEKATFKRLCQGGAVLPVAIKSGLLVKDTVQHATHATKLVTTLQSDVTSCAAGVAVKTGAKAATMSKDIVSCVSAKIKNA